MSSEVKVNSPEFESFQNEDASIENEIVEIIQRIADVVVFNYLILE